MSVTKYFCGFKTAFVVDEDHEYIADLIADDKFFDIMLEKEEFLPDGWTFTGVDTAGAAGFVITFDLDIMPHEDEMTIVKDIMDDINTAEKIRQDFAKVTFNPDEMEGWSVYGLTDEMIEIAKELWYKEGMQGDYETIADIMSIDIKPSNCTKPWDKSMMKKIPSEYDE